jgi:hypothetical protein
LFTIWSLSKSENKLFAGRPHNTYLSKETNPYGCQPQAADSYRIRVKRISPPALSKSIFLIAALESAANLGSNTIGLDTWQTASLQTADGQKLTITATPAQHGPHGAEVYSGQVSGFVLSWEEEVSRVLYFSGDTVRYEELTQVAQQFEVGVALLNLGAARLEVIGSIEP